ncbi:sulfite oxidase [Pseudorhodoplanes sp.]|uniref:sulfite oxidase n=1 Tax=Pseudorhodoplanes sp. TaxID=1934341 RepID=UPI002BC38ECE|nr:sulfite oxidase [Pseudorhodoplanes sp.]HWV55007.1 sulfite oxidase [Pseudorhodoplanes sp.]
MMKIERSLEELYADDPERADTVAFGRKTGVDRRGFLGGAGLAAMGAVVGGSIPFAANMPGGLVPAAMAQDKPAAPAAPAAKGPTYLNFPGKSDKLVVLGEKPLVAETPEAQLDDDTTPTEKFFVRNNGQIPDEAKDADKWRIKIDGEVNKPIDITLGELKAKFKPVTRRMVLECGGNGRSFFTPQARGNQWTNGGAGCAEWTGVRVADVLKAAGVKPSAVFSGHYGADPHLSGDTSRVAISRGVPIKKLMDENNLIVWAMNGQPLPNIHGGPVRLLIGGWPGSVSAKWLNRIWIRDKVHDGQGMGGTSYRVAINPMVPGGKADEKNFRDLESMPVRSIITNPADGTKIPAGTREVKLRGASWAGDYEVKQVDVSLDYGATWQRAQLGKPKNKYDWQRWTANVKLPSDGYFEIWTRGTDSRGIAQPHVAGFWNPQGYGANPMHRVRVLVG